jgi:CheY-like chemotaxis protein
MIETFKKNRIMVVDDEEFCIASMRTILQKAGVNVVHQVDFCINGMEAYQQVEEGLGAGLIHRLIFTDFNMPKMNGI